MREETSKLNLLIEETHEAIEALEFSCSRYPKTNTRAVINLLKRLYRRLKELRPVKHRIDRH